MRLFIVCLLRKYTRRLWEKKWNICHSYKYILALVSNLLYFQLYRFFFSYAFNYFISKICQLHLQNAPRIHFTFPTTIRGLPWWLRWKRRIHLQCRKPRFNPWVRKIPYPLATHSQYSCLENSMDYLGYYINLQLMSWLLSSILTRVARVKLLKPKAHALTPLLSSPTAAHSHSK